MLAAGIGATLIGGCGGASEDDRARDAVDTYISATARHDARRVCGVFASSVQAEAARAQDKAGEEGGCAGAVARAWKDQRPLVLTDTKVLGTRVAGDRARVAIEGTGNRIRQRTTFSLVRQDGGWHVLDAGRATTPDGRRVYTAPTDGMSPLLRRGDQFVVDAHAYDVAAPKVGDVVLAHPPQGGADNVPCPGHGDPKAYGFPKDLCVRPDAPRGEESVVKRVVAGPGDRVAFRGGHAIVDGRRADEPFVASSSCADDDAAGCDYPRAITVPAGRYYLVGDDRGNSSDSRLWGSVPKDWIVGRVV